VASAVGKPQRLYFYLIFYKMSDKLLQAYHRWPDGHFDKKKKVKELNKDDVIKPVCEKCGNDDEYYFYYIKGEKTCWKCKE